MVKQNLTFRGLATEPPLPLITETGIILPVRVASQPDRRGYELEEGKEGVRMYSILCKYE